MSELQQFSHRVVNFSSQYGTTGLYSADNLAGEPQIGDRYGDFMEAFVLRTYGKWWKSCSSAAQKLSKVAPNFISEDFVELEFVEAVIPEAIVIHETYHPGSVVRILVCNTTSKDNTPGKVKWVTLWSGPPQCSQIPQAMRKFSPPLKKISFPTRFIRLEFNSEDCQYYTELDAVSLIGKVPNSTSSPSDRALGFQVDITTKLLQNLSLDRQISTSSQDGDDDFEKWSFWAMLPDEVIQRIFSYLDIISLCNVAQTCTLLLKNAYDPLLFSDLDLQSRWNTVDNVALESLMTRCTKLKRLNLSWTGGGGLLTEDIFCRFLEECGKELKTLRLACCQYITSQAVKTIADRCAQLEELDLQSCNQLDNEALLYIEEIKNLKRLNLYGITLRMDVVTAIGNCEKMEHLNLGGCQVEKDELASPGMTLRSSMKPSDAIHDTLKKFKNIVSLDLWRLEAINSAAIINIAKNCPQLEELDIGWCPVIESDIFPCDLLCSKCPKLKKLFLTAGRNVVDDDMHSIAKYCKGMEQLDILGASEVSESGVYQVCKGCPKLTLFDISFCEQLDEEKWERLKLTYPHIFFKRSFE